MLLLVHVANASPNVSTATDPSSACTSYRAILVGVDLPNRHDHNVSDDIALLESYFKQWLPANNVDVLTNRRARHESLFNTLESVAGQSANVCTIIYFAGDVFDTQVTNKDLDNEETLSYLMAWLSPDRTYPTIGSKGISFAILNAWFSQSGTGPILLIVDNQVGGSQAGYRAYAETQSPYPYTGQAPPRFIFSTSTKRRVKHTINGQMHSILALGLVEGLFHQAADQNADALVDIRELSDYLNRVIPAMSDGAVFLRSRVMQSGFGSAGAYGSVGLTKQPVSAPVAAPIKQHMAAFNNNNTNYPAPTATLDVNAFPPGKLYLDGELLGSTPQTGLVVPAGERTLEVITETFDAWQQNVFLSAGTANVIEATLQSEFGRFAIENLPPDARVILNDTLQFLATDLGDTPARVPKGFYLGQVQYGNGERLPFDLSVRNSAVVTYDFRSDVVDYRESFRSVLIPGWGQRRDGAIGKGNAFIGIMVAGGAALAASNLLYDSAAKDYQETFDAYVLEQIEVEALALWDDTVKKFNRANLLNDIRNGLIIGMVGFYVYNIVDAMIFHARHDQMVLQEPGDASFSARGHWNAAGAGMTLTYSWR
ncbi:MAG: DUF5683 domain-containing protein [Bacteroidota bacterium]